MVPLEAEPAGFGGSQDDGDGTRGGSGGVANSGAEVAESGASAPISVLSRLALKDALIELEATARRTRDVSNSAALQLWHLAEKRLGLEVDIDDPALRGLFGLHVLAVEELCARVRAQAEATFAAVETWCQPQLQTTASGLRLLSDSERGDGSALGEAVGADLQEAEAATGAARVRLLTRIQSEVYEVMDLRLREHAGIREDVRERQRWHANAVAARRDVAWARKGASGTSSGLRALNLYASNGPVEEAEIRLREAMKYVNQLDERLLTRLMDLQAESVDVVRRPWAALVQIQSEFYMAQQAIWVPLVDTFAEFAA
mmetsp:Transcript_47950/g.104700  ORF Transcript_47950/g.104700 Transcript_47950/m.104700 type:complete len:316 (-) Transcript_47950:115-1062(-)